MESEREISFMDFISDSAGVREADLRSVEGGRRIGRSFLRGFDVGFSGSFLLLLVVVGRSGAAMCSFEAPVSVLLSSSSS